MSTSSALPVRPLPLDKGRPRLTAARFALGAAAWGTALVAARPAAHGIVSLLGLDPSSKLGAAIEFFLFDAPFLLLLFVGASFVMGVINSYFPPERVRELLAGRREYVGNGLAALLGVVTPFCTCSAIPLFLALVEAGVPLGVTFSFLVAAPMVNEIALVFLLGVFGWQVTLLYLGAGLTIAVVSGFVVGRLGMERYVEAWVRERVASSTPAANASLTLGERAAGAVSTTKMVTKKVLPYIAVGVGVGAVITGQVPGEILASVASETGWWAVPVAVAIGVPLYGGAVMVVPMLQPLAASGAALGTMLAFTMSVVGLSLPEFIVLRRVLKLRLIVTFVAIVATGILLTGWLFNAVLTS